VKVVLIKSSDARVSRKGNIKKEPITKKGASKDEAKKAPLSWKEYLTETQADNLTITDMYLFLEYRALLQSDTYARYCRALRAGRGHKKAQSTLSDIEPEYKNIQSVYSFWGRLGGANRQADTFLLWLRDNAHKVNRLTTEHISFDGQKNSRVQVTLPSDYLPSKNIEKLKQALARTLNKELHYYKKANRAKAKDQANLYRIEQALDIYFLKKYHKFNGHQCAEVTKVSNKKCWREFVDIHFSSGIIISNDITPLITELTTDAEKIITSALNGTFPFFNSSKAQSKYF